MNIKLWFRTIRPKTLIASISPVLIGTVMADTVNFITLFFTLTTAIGIQICTNLSNDYFDYIKGADTEHRKGPVRAIQAGLVSVQDMKRAALIAMMATALSGMVLVYQGGIIISLLLAVSLALSVLYTAGPFALAYTGLGDLFVFFFFGPIATVGTLFLQTGTLSYPAILAGIAPGALSCAILACNNLRDVSEDRSANKRTLIVRFGVFFGKVEYLVMICLAALVPLLLIREKPFALLASLIIFPAIPCFRMLFRHEFIALFPKTPPLLILYTILFCLGSMY
jgi:1,4-dihydroxy-2-naphthoate octaprenyltransferase